MEIGLRMEFGHEGSDDERFEGGMDSSYGPDGFPETPVEGITATEQEGPGDLDDAKLSGAMADNDDTGRPEESNDSGAPRDKPPVHEPPATPETQAGHREPPEPPEDPPLGIGSENPDEEPENWREIAFVEEPPSLEVARELARLQRAVVLATFDKLADFIDIDYYGGREKASIELEHITPEGISRKLTIWRDTGQVSLDGKTPEGWRLVVDYKTLRQQGLRRYERAPEIARKRGELPAEFRIQQSIGKRAEGEAIKGLELGLHLNYHPVGPTEAQYIRELVQGSRPRLTSLHQLDTTCITRSKSARPVGVEGARQGGQEFTLYVSTFLSRQGHWPTGKRATALQMNTIDTDGRSLTIIAGERRDALGLKDPFVRITADWDLSEPRREQLRSRYGSRADYVKSILTLDYAVVDGRLRIIRNCHLEDAQGLLFYRYRPIVVSRADQTEARQVRNFLASPSFTNGRRTDTWFD